ncbi:MAG: hypothetical protein ACE5I4_04785 [Thermoplasmata archaeon]
MGYSEQLEGAAGLAEVFELVKRVVQDNLGQIRAGLMLGLADLGNHPRGFIGGFHAVGSNVIVMNKVPLLRIQDTNEALYKPYVFNVLLHEYLHTLGYLPEGTVRPMVAQLSEKAFGPDHLVTRIGRDYATFFPNLVYPEAAWQPEEFSLELVSDFDKGSASYIG